ncbi:MAG: DUF5919 domain-containing protein [Micromonosporaceae bacterium]
MATRSNALRLLLRHRHWQPHRTFIAEYDKAAAAIDKRLVGGGPSRVQLHRWQSGQLVGLPYPDHCRVLETMFTGWTVSELFAPCSTEQITDREREAVSAPETAGRPTQSHHAARDDRFCGVTAVYATRGEFMSAMPPKTLFDDATRIRAVGLSLNLLCQHYPDQSLYKLAESGTTFHCLFLDPNGDAIRAREREEGHSPHRLSTLTDLNIHLLRRVRDRLPDERRANIELAVYDETVRNNIIFVNDDICVAQPYLNDARGLDSPTFVIQRRWPDQGLFPVYEEVFTSLWKRSRPV